MKKILSILTLGMLTSCAYADELKSFHEIYNSLQAGKNIKLLINFDHCTPTPPVSNIQVYTTPTAVMMRKNYLQFSNTPLTTNNPMFPKTPILENCTYKITDNNQITITTRVIKLPDYAVMNETTSVCSLGTSVKVYN